MRQVEREELIRRYMENAMTSVEEENFFIQVALDRNLRVELKAQQLIESTILKDRTLDASEFSLLESRIEATLIGSNPLAAVAVSGIGRWGAALLMLGTVTMLVMLAVPLLPVPHAGLLMPGSAEKIVHPKGAGTLPVDLLRLSAGEAFALPHTFKNVIITQSISDLPRERTEQTRMQEITSHKVISQEKREGRSRGITKRGAESEAENDIAPQTIQTNDDSTHIGVSLIVTPPTK
jgi:hypothetical protein